MLEWLAGLNPIVQAGLAGVMTWFVTALGSCLVFLCEKSIVKCSIL